MQTWNMRSITELQRNWLVLGGRAFNTALDFVFYDVDSLTPAERDELSAHVKPEGSILKVYPAAEKRRIEKLTPWEFVFEQRGNSVPIDALVVAGVGSSALGTAALARNVANYVNRPTAGIVSGLGMADVFEEAMGGWFVLEFKNSIRNAFARMFHAFDMRDHVWDDDSYRMLVKDEEIADFEMDRYVFGSPDSAALLLLLYHLRDKIKLLVGHSKGNYIIENALEGLVSLCALKKHDMPGDLKVVTLGAVVRFPDPVSKVAQFMGLIDWFGMMNSQIQLNTHWIPGAWHSLNKDLPGHLSVGETLRQAGVQ